MAENTIDIAGASQDFQTIEDFVNLPAGSDVRPRLLPSINVGTLAGARQAIFEAGGLPATPFKTKALMTASALANDKYAMVTDDTANNGLYVKTAGAWVKSDYDPVLQSKTYADAQRADILSKATHIAYGDLTKNPAGVYPNKGLSGSTIVNSSAYDCMAIAVDGVTVISGRNNIDNYVTGRAVSFHSALPPSTENLIAVVAASMLDSGGGRYATYNVPIAAKFAVFNTRINTDVITWEFQAGVKLVPNIKSGRILTAFNGAEVTTLPTELRTEDASNVDGNLYSKANNVLDRYIATNGIYASSAGTAMAVIPVVEGLTYTITADPAAYSNGYFVGSYSTSAVADGNLKLLWQLKTTDEDTKRRFTVPKGLGIKFLFISIKISSVDVRDTLYITESRFLNLENTKSVKTLLGYELADLQSRKRLNAIENTNIRSRFAGKDFVFLGDSITAGTKGGYVKYVAERIMCNPSNRGSSGARANRVVDIVTANSGLARRDSGTAGTAWGTIDFSTVAGVSLMIGTNDSTSGIQGSIESSIPTDNLAANVGNELAYFERFANDYYGNIALVIEWIKWKNPLCEIFLVSAYRKGADPKTIEQIIPALKALGEFYSVPYINGTYNSGISYKFMNIYGEDGVPTSSHLDVIGNKLLGNYLATKILAGG